jgi:D-alanine-D-alanine ligase
MGKKIRLGILFGGRSAEHEVSVQSARNIVDALDKDKYEVVLIGIDKQGQWSLNEGALPLLESGDGDLPSFEGNDEQRVAFVSESGGAELVRTSDNAHLGAVDVVFPILHGPFGEDGTVQGMLKLFDLPYVGGGVLGSAVGMDKDVMKRLLRDAGILIGDFRCVYAHTRDRVPFASLSEALGVPLFVKPANLGSSVGISKVSDAREYEAALDEAFRYDTKVVVEANIAGREIECAVLGNESPIASVPGEVIPRHEFYSYEAKYIDEHGAALEIPADLPFEVAQDVKDLAIETFQVLCCEGMARVDFFLTPDDRLVLNEINTIPGFTRISMFPKLFEASGISYSELIDRLVQLAIERHERDVKLKTSR